MTTSAQPAAGSSGNPEHRGDSDLLTEPAPPPGAEAGAPTAPDPYLGDVRGDPDLPDVHGVNGVDDRVDISAFPGTEAAGMPGRGVTLVSLVIVILCAGVDVLLTQEVTMFFDLCFVVVCLVATMAVRRRDLFTTGVLPPLLFAAVVACVATIDPGVFVQVGGVFKASMSGLAQHATGLVAGYAVALLTVGCRVSAQRPG